MARRSDGVGSGVSATDWLCAIGGRTDAAKVPRNARRFTSGLRDNGATTLAAHEVDGNRRWRVDASTAARSQLASSWATSVLVLRELIAPPFEGGAQTFLLADLAEFDADVRFCRIEWRHHVEPGMHGIGE